MMNVADRHPNFPSQFLVDHMKLEQVDPVCLNACLVLGLYMCKGAMIGPLAYS